MGGFGAAGAPSGTYTGNKNILGAQVHSQIVIDDATHADLNLNIDGLLKIGPINCPKEQYSLDWVPASSPSPASTPKETASTTSSPSTASSSRAWRTTPTRTPSPSRSTRSFSTSCSCWARAPWRWT